MVKRMNIKNPEACTLVRELAAKSGGSLTQTVLDALRAHKNALAMERGDALLYKGDDFVHAGLGRVV